MFETTLDTFTAATFHLEHTPTFQQIKLFFLKAHLPIHSLCHCETTW